MLHCNIVLSTIELTAELRYALTWQMLTYQVFDIACIDTAVVFDLPTWVKIYCNAAQQPSSRVYTVAVGACWCI